MADRSGNINSGNGEFFTVTVEYTFYYFCCLYLIKGEFDLINLYHKL